MGKQTDDPSDRPPRIEDEIKAVDDERRANRRLIGQLIGGAAVGGAITHGQRIIDGKLDPDHETPHDAPDPQNVVDDPSAGDTSPVSDVTDDPGEHFVTETYWTQGIYAVSSSEHDPAADLDDTSHDTGDVDEHGDYGTDV
ncbi:hypothetical protein OM076_06010 [Solirubrobacter ginsenosidimutans]|uniref:Uncharacterized protein n=1 Tax=Solirubrobacter ginsenosidimutans TaxID=490573 RepID=A0A9X3S3R6_9ACTN|nr:hypothetical protein [Solirubrobacter ginsenosidimutans]MDA0159808.1 hypothetical protein [Solirubrobacter ginsenosidimutans]